MKSANCRCTWKLWIVVSAACSLVWCGRVAADEESPRLAPYRKNVDRAVDMALMFLARAQTENPAGDGSFADVHGQTNALAGLSGMAFLAKGYRPGVAPYGANINKSIDYILATETKNGYLGVRGGKMYEHSIATLFLSEVSGMVDPARQQRIDVMLPRALKIILDAQQVPKQKSEHSGGWRYEPDSKDSDMSITGWCLMALRSARLNGATVPNKAIDDALGFMARCEHAEGGYRYETLAMWALTKRSAPTPVAATPACSAAGLLCRELTGHHADQSNRKTAAYLLKVTATAELFPESHHEYATYYAAQGLFQFGGDAWEQYAERMYRYLLAKQQSNGAWFREGSGEVYPTTMYALALAVTYRQLPIYQR